MKIAIIGECMVELRLATPESAHIAYSGDTLNTAVYLSRAGGFEAVNYVTALGNDAFSDKMLKFFEEEGLATDLIERRAGKTPGLYAIETDASGERKFTYWRYNSAARTLFAPEENASLAALAAFDLVYFSGVSLAILGDGARARLLDWAAEHRVRGGKIAFDSNYRPALWPSRDAAAETVERMWRMADIGFPSVDDEMALFGDADEAAVLERLRGWGLRDGALKRGPQGPAALNRNIATETFAPAERVVDTTAAGDSFNAGWLSAWARGEDGGARLRAGHSLARKVVGFPGAIVPR
jgi:2-dehydro-3-deoxygluconokinase